MQNYDINEANRFFRARTTFTTGVHELEVLINSKADPAGYQVVDVRFPADYAKAHVPGAINLPKVKWRNPQGLSKDATLYLYCYTPTCHLAAEAAVELTAQGYRVVEVEGGWERWELGGYATESGTQAA
jgi:rhodanese-related sulfurtransferase